MKTMNIFEQEVSYFYNLKSTKPLGTTSIRKVLEVKKCKFQIEEYRRTGNPDIKMSLPCYTVSGVFSERKESGLIKHSGVVCIDVDLKDNSKVGNFKALKSLITKIPYVAYCSLSCSGEGYFVLIPIEHLNKHREHYGAICDDFERCGIKTDRCCIDVSRLRIASFDDEAYFNEQAVVYTRTVSVEPEKQDKKNDFESGKTANFNFENTAIRVEAIVHEILEKQIDITTPYPAWFEIGAALANHFGSCGRKYFHDISKFNKEYDKQKVDDQYTACLTTRKFTIATLFHYARLNGIHM